jgi:hypothetical protein
MTWQYGRCTNRTQHRGKLIMLYDRDLRGDYFVRHLHSRTSMAIGTSALRVAFLAKATALLTFFAMFGHALLFAGIA